MQELLRRVLAATIAEHSRPGQPGNGHCAEAPVISGGVPGIEVGGRLRVRAIDATVTRMPNTKANRETFGSAEQADTGYPQIRHLHVSDAFTRATLAVVTGPSDGDKAETEQGLLDRALTKHPRVFTPDLIAQEHPAWITTTELIHATTRTTATLAEPFRKGPHTGQAVTARHLSFTTTRRTLITTVRTSGATATASPPAPTRAAAHHTALTVIATTRATTDRHHHRDHKIKTRQAFGHAPRTITTRTTPDRARLHHHHRHDQRHRGLITDHRPAPRQPRSTIPGMEPGAPGQTAGPPP